MEFMGRLQSPGTTRAAQEMVAGPPDHTSTKICGGRASVPICLEAMCLPVALASVLLALWDFILTMWLQRSPATATGDSAALIQGIAAGMACSQVGFLAAWLVLSTWNYRARIAGLLAICWLVPCLMPFHALQIMGMRWETAAIVAGVAWGGLTASRVMGSQLLLVAGNTVRVLTPRRRQFSLGQILGAVTSVAVVLAVLGYPRRPIVTDWIPSLSLAVGMGVCTLASLVALLATSRLGTGILIPFLTAAATLGLLEVFPLSKDLATWWRFGIVTHALITCGGFLVARASGLRWSNYGPPE